MAGEKVCPRRPGRDHDRPFTRRDPQSPHPVESRCAQHEATHRLLMHPRRLMADGDRACEALRGEGQRQARRRNPVKRRPDTNDLVAAPGSEDIEEQGIGIELVEAIP